MGRTWRLSQWGEVRREVSAKLGFSEDALDVRKKEIRKMIEGLLQDMQGNAVDLNKKSLEQLLEQPEKNDGLQRVYLITLSRVQDATLEDGRAYADLSQMDRKTVAQAVLDAFDNPLSSPGGGRPRDSEDDAAGLVEMLVVFKEFHKDGAVHFHVVAKLS